MLRKLNSEHEGYISNFCIVFSETYCVDECTGDMVWQYDLLEIVGKGIKVDMRNCALFNNEDRIRYSESRQTRLNDDDVALVLLHDFIENAKTIFS